jgi:beta-phosphoglucomutase-like phosphatase (HAD superfamily)
MSRYEIAELEDEIRAMGEGEEEEELEEEEIAAIIATPEHKRMIERMQKLAKLRHGVIKAYFEKHKYKRAHRNEIIEAAEASEEAIKELMRDKHVHFLDALPEIREFMEQVNKDQNQKVEVVLTKKGGIIGENLPDIKRLMDKPVPVAPKKAAKKKPKPERTHKIV